MKLQSASALKNIIHDSINLFVRVPLATFKESLYSKNDHTKTLPRCYPFSTSVVSWPMYSAGVCAIHLPALCWGNAVVGRTACMEFRFKSLRLVCQYSSWSGTQRWICGSVLDSLPCCIDHQGARRPVVITSI